MQPLLNSEKQNPTEQAVFLEQVSEERSTLMDQLKHNQEEYKNVSLDNKRLQQELDGYKKELKKQIELFKDAQQKLDDATKLSTTLQQQLNFLSNKLKDVNEKRNAVSTSLNELLVCKRNIQCELTELKDSMVLKMNSLQETLKQEFCKAKNDFTIELNKYKRRCDQEKDKLHQRIEYLQSEIDHRQKGLTDSIKLAGHLSDGIERHDAFRRRVFASTSQSLSVDHKKIYSKGSSRTKSHKKFHTIDDSDDGSSDSVVVTKQVQIKHLLSYPSNCEFEKTKVSSEDTQDEESEFYEPSSKNTSMD